MFLHIAMADMMNNKSPLVHIASVAITFAATFGLIQMAPVLATQIMPVFAPRAQNLPAIPAPHRVTLALVNGNSIFGELLARNPRTGMVVLGWKGGAVSFRPVEVREMKFHTDEYKPLGDGVYILNQREAEEACRPAFGPGKSRPSFMEQQSSSLGRAASSAGSRVREWRGALTAYRNILRQRGF